MSPNGADMDVIKKKKDAGTVKLVREKKKKAHILPKSLKVQALPYPSRLAPKPCQRQRSLPPSLPLLPFSLSLLPNAYACLQYVFIRSSSLLYPAPLTCVLVVSCTTAFLKCSLVSALPITRCYHALGCSVGRGAE